MLIHYEKHYIYEVKVLYTDVIEPYSGQILGIDHDKYVVVVHGYWLSFRGFDHYLVVLSTSD